MSRACKEALRKVQKNRSRWRVRGTQRSRDAVRNPLVPAKTGPSTLAQARRVMRRRERCRHLAVQLLDPGRLVLAGGRRSSNIRALDVLQVPDLFRSEFGEPPRPGKSLAPPKRVADVVTSSLAIHRSRGPHGVGCGSRCLSGAPGPARIGPGTSGRRMHPISPLFASAPAFRLDLKLSCSCSRVMMRTR